MRSRPKPADPARGQSPSSTGILWMNRLQHLVSLVYLAGGGLLLYLYFSRMSGTTYLLVGAIFVLFCIYRFGLMWQAARKRRH